MDSPASYLNWSFINISLPNLLLIVLMILVFVMAIVLPFPRHKRLSPARQQAAGLDAAAGESSNWTARLRGAISDLWPWHQVLPDRQPAFVSSWVYLFGVGAIASFIWIVISGVIMVFFGPTWWHVDGTGRFVNSVHFWSVQLFFFCMVLHLWGQYFMASWRNGRALTWMFGVALFAVSIAAAFTGYLSQQNLDAQWIALNGKDAINSTGLGAFFNVLDYGQMFGIHVMLLPAVAATLIAIHVLLVRLRGVVRPIGDDGTAAQIAGQEAKS
jgi:ubiquinol-cytochrome c reductase cytochrome b subunit